MFLAIELCLTAICLAIGSIRPEIGDHWFSRVEAAVSNFAARKALAVVSVGLLALVLRAALLPILPIPQPEVHDEYSYLLLGDTFAHGRLANPSHPMWTHFETYHVNWQPHYASMYYPGQGLFLAFGQKVFGHPFWGVWLSVGLMCSAICWALQGWLPAGWALLGALVAVIRLGTFSYWADSYWGGAVPALGGALAMGALPRIKQSQRIPDAVFLAGGMALLANTRPYEGLFLCVPVLASLLWWMWRKDSPSLKRSLARIILPVGCVMALVFAGMAYYFWQVTGDPFTTPYQLNIRTYGLVYFPWQKINEIPEFHHAVMRQLYRGGAVVGMYNFAHQHWVKLQFSKALVVWLFYFGPVMTMPWLIWLLTRFKSGLRRHLESELRLVLLLCFANCVALGLTIYVGQPHYAAPFTAVFYIASLLVMRDLDRCDSNGQPSRRFIVRSVLLICLVLFMLRVAAPALQIEPEPSWIRTWCSKDPQNFRRAEVGKQLEERPGNHLVIVRYKPDHDFILDEWVFNNADIDDAKVIWARDMGSQNAELIHYFSGRQVWLVEPDYNPPKLSPYAK
jgi:hypothetical protein